MRRIAVAALAAVGLMALPARAQQAWNVEVGGFGRYTFFDPSRGYDDAIGPSGRLGVFVHPRWAIEADASFASGNGPAGDFNYTPLHARLIYNLPISDRTELLLGAGGAYNDFGNDPRLPRSEIGHAALAGIRFGMSERLALRFDVTFDHLPSAINDNEGTCTFEARGCVARFASNEYWGLQTGISYFLNLREQREQGPFVATAEPAPPPPAAQPEPQPAPPAPAPTPVKVADDDGAAAHLRASAILAERVHFDFDRYDIRPDASDVLGRKVAVLRANADVALRIEGHADERGSNEYNLALGMRRANATRNFLVAKGIDMPRLEISSLGEEQPLDPASTEEAWALNRRAEFRTIRSGTRLKLPPEQR